MKSRRKKLTFFLVRRTPAHAVKAHVEIVDTEAGQSMVLRRLTADAGGNAPNVTDLVGKHWASRSELRAAIMNRMWALDPRPVCGAERLAVYHERQREAGLVLVREWIPEGRVQELRQIAKEMREKYLKYRI